MSLALLRRNVPLFWQGELPGVSYSLVCCSAEVLSWGSSGVQDVIGWVWMCLRVAGPAAVEGAVSQRGAMQQAGVGAVSVALVFSCCQLHVSALSRSLEKV